MIAILAERKLLSGVPLPSLDEEINPAGFWHDRSGVSADRRISIFQMAAFCRKPLPYTVDDPATAHLQHRARNHFAS